MLRVATQRKKTTRNKPRRKAGASRRRRATATAAAAIMGKKLDRARGRCAVGLLIVDDAADPREMVGPVLVEGPAEAARTSSRSKSRGPRRSTRKSVSAVAIRALAAIAHPVRATILQTLLNEPATYQTLVKRTRCQAGPLYHHVNQLRLAGLVMPKQRDLYELTASGRNLLMLAMAAGQLMGVRKRRLGRIKH